MKHLLASTKNQQEFGLSEPHPACLTMANWYAEDWTRPTEFSSFPILDICPDAPAHFAKAGHFTARDLRAIVANLGLDASHRDPESVYRQVLERAQNKPWVLPVLEVMVAERRVGGETAKAKRKKVNIVLTKMPLAKLRLDRNPDLHPRVSELLSPQVETDICVAAFCEYAIACYFSKLDTEDSVQLYREAKETLIPDMPEAIDDTILGDIADIEDWEAHASTVIAFAQDHDNATSDDFYQHAITTLRQLCEGIAQGLDSSTLYQISELAHICAKQIELSQKPQRDTVLAHVAKLGIEHNPDQVTDEAIVILATAFDQGLASSMRAHSLLIAELEDGVSEMKERISAAGQNEDYTLLSELAPKAKIEKDALSAAHDRHAQLLVCLDRLLSGGVTVRDADIEKIRIYISNARAEQTDPGGVNDVLLPGLYDANATEDSNDAAEGTSQIPSDTHIPDADEIGAEGEVDDESEDDSPTGTERLVDPKEAAAPLGSIEANGEDIIQDQDTQSNKASPALASPAVSAHNSDPIAANISHSDSRDEPRLDQDESTASNDTTHLDENEAEPAGTIIQAEIAVAEKQIEMPVSLDVLANLINRDLLGVAADAAESFELHGRPWPISAAILKTAAGSRAPHREYGLDTQRFLSLANRAAIDVVSELGSVLLLGAMIRAAILEKSAASLRNSMPDLCRGSLGQHLQKTAEAISELDYDFPPDADELARMAGTQRIPQKQRIAAQLGQWTDTVAVKTSRWPFATAVMHHVASESGPIGAARAAIDAGETTAPQLARQAIDALSSAAAIETLSTDQASRMGRMNARLHPKGVEYLERQFDEPLGLLDSWLRVAAREGSHGQRSETRLRTIVSNLVSRLEKAHNGLCIDAARAPDALTGAIATWIAMQTKEALRALRGEDTGQFATFEEALTAERDLLPASVRDALEIPDMRFDAFRDMLVTDSVPDPHGALRRACDEGAFETAMRLTTRFKINTNDAIAEDMTAFAKTWETEINTRSRRLKTLAKVDYKHQDEIGRRLNWCEIAMARLGAIKDRSEVHDLTDVPAATAELDSISGMIEDNIRQDQIERIGQYRNDQNASEADALLSGLKGITVEATEDRIAQLRDGRSAATFETELGGLISDFSPAFLSYATSSEWPATDEAFEAAVAAEGPLLIEEDRRAVGLTLIKLFRAIAESTAQRQPDVPKIRALFEDIGYERVKIHDFRPIGRTGVWHGRLTGTIRSVHTDDWFLPPVFGSQASAGTHFMLIGPDALPENVMKSLSSDAPTILLYTSIVDAARRLELAERLRASAVPALLIDEALIAFTATHRQTRAETIFECGLPYGRVEPYTTDAGQLPPEMFFGRGEEIRLIMSKTADGCLVYGGRQLGKSALLGHIARTLHAPEQGRIVVNREVRSLGNSEKTSEIWAHLASMLSPDVVRAGSRTAEDVARDIRAWLMHNPQGRIVAMFDEADNFMDADTREDYPELARLKKLMEDTGRAFKVVFAGLHNVQRMHRQPNSPLAHLGQPICIGPLNRTEDDKRAAHDLVITPMRAAGFRFESHEAVEEILAWANYYPSLVQEYMKGLLSTLHGAGSGKAYKLSSNGPLWPIPSDTLFDHRGFGHIESRIRYKFHLTLDLDPRYALVAYTLGRLNVEGQEDKARVIGFEPSELLDEARIFWPRSSEVPALAGFEALLEELFDLGVLGRVPIPQTKRYRYLLGSRQVATMLGSEDDIYHALGEIEEKDPAIAYDRAIHRRRYTSGNVTENSEWHYCPLTDLQIERIVQPDHAAVQIVCGLEALGLSKVGPSLRRISQTGHLPGAPDHGIEVEIVKTPNEMRARVEAKSRGGLTSIVVFTSETAKQANEVIAWLERQPRVLNKQVRPLLLLDAAETHMRDIATRRPEQSQFLATWGAEMLRVHLHHIEKVELDTRPYRTAILSTTGGIPSETIKLIAAMRVATDPMEVVESWTVNLRVPPGLLNEALGKALGMLEMADGDDYETFNDLVREHTGADLTDLGPDLVATGLISGWKPKSGRIRRSALGDLLCKQMNA